MEIIKEDLSFSDDSLTDIFVSKPRPKIMKNLPIQKPLSVNLRQNLKIEAIEKILDDPILNQIDSSRPLAHIEKLKVVDTATQMTYRKNECGCKTLQSLNYPNGFSSKTRSLIDESINFFNSETMTRVLGC